MAESESSQSDELLERIRGGDADAMAQWLELRKPQLIGYIFRKLSDALRRKVEPEDIFQEVSADCVRSFREIDLSDRDPFGWVCNLVDRRVVDAHRHFQAQKRESAREVPLGMQGGETGQAGLINMLVASMTSASQVFSRNQKESQIQQAIAQLPDEHRDVLHMRYVEGLPSKEIAARLDKSDAAVRVMLTRTIKKLQQLLETDPPSSE